MAQRILILDTSVLCCYLKVPGMESTGPDTDRLSAEKITDIISKEVEAGATLVLPLASIIETGNHISQSSHSMFDTAGRLSEIMTMAASQTSPWAAFTDQAVLWSPKRLTKLAEEWPKLANARLSIGDATIKDVAEYYAEAGWEVEIVTGDQGLKAYQPAKPPLIPRRRQK